MGENVSERVNVSAAEVNAEFGTYVWPVALVVAVFALVGIFGNIFVLYVHISKYPACNFSLPVALVLVVFALVGIFGNIFVLYVHISKYPACNFRYFVLGLCAVDLTSSLTILPMEVYTQLHWFLFPFAWLCKVKAFLHVLLSISSVYVLLLIAVDRYRKVCAPHDWQMTSQLIAKCYGVCFIIALCQSWPVTIVWGLNLHLHDFEGAMVKVSVCSTDSASRDTVWSKVFLVMMLPQLGAMVAMVIMYSFVARKIFGVVQKMKQKSTRKRKCTQLQKEDDLHEDDDVFGDSGPHSDSVIDSKLREEILEPLNGSKKKVQMVAYKVHDSGIVYERGNSLKRDNSSKNLKLTFEDLKKLEEKAPKQSYRNSESSAESVRMTQDSRERTRSRGYSTASTIPESTEHELEENGEETPKPVEYKTDTLKSIGKTTMRRKSLFQKRVRFSKLARDKLKRRTLITFVFTAIYIITTITYVVISGHVVNDEGNTLSFSELSVLIFFYRLYFINNVIHPIIYGALDPRFRKTLRSTSKKLLDSVWRSHHEGEEKH